MEDTPVGVQRMSLKIFVVEDDDDLREMLTCQLTEQGHTVAPFANGNEVIKQFARNERPPDIVFLDLVMPEKSGLEVLKHIRSLSHLAGLPVVIMSGYRDEKMVRASLQAGVKDFLVKPIESSTLTERLRGLSVLHSTDEARAIASRCHHQSPEVFETPEFKRYKNKGWVGFRTSFCGEPLVVLINESFSAERLLKLDEDLLAQNLRIFVDKSPWVPTWPRHVQLPAQGLRPADELRQDLGDELFELLETHSRHAG